LELKATRYGGISLSPDEMDEVERGMIDGAETQA
jgi:hypothetical protein